MYIYIYIYFFIWLANTYYCKRLLSNIQCQWHNHLLFLLHFLETLLGFSTNFPTHPWSIPQTPNQQFMVRNSCNIWGFFRGCLGYACETGVCNGFPLEIFKRLHFQPSNLGSPTLQPGIPGPAGWQPLSLRPDFSLFPTGSSVCHWTVAWQTATRGPGSLCILGAEFCLPGKQVAVNFHQLYP